MMAKNMCEGKKVFQLKLDTLMSSEAREVNLLS